MKVAINFVVPIRHYENSSNWNETIANLVKTLESILHQTSNNWRCTIVVNRGATLPLLDERIDVCLVDFPPNTMYLQGNNKKVDFLNAVKLDKGKRVLSGLKSLGPSDFVMVVDDDDFIHSGLVSYVEANSDSFGWYIGKGYIWNSGGKMLLKTYSFNEICGTSLILKRDLLILPNDESPESVQYIMNFFGSHKFQVEYFLKNGTPLSELPFFAAIYRVGHSDAHSKGKGGFFRYAVFNKTLITEPFQSLRKLFMIRIVGRKLKKIFRGV